MTLTLTREQADALVRLIERRRTKAPDAFLKPYERAEHDANDRNLRDVLDALRRPRGGR